MNREDDVGWLKSIAGFANASGGEFYIGGEDKTNKLIGFDRRNSDSERNYFNNQVNEHLTPRPAMKISFVRYEINGNERFIIKVIVEESAVKPVILRYKNIQTIMCFGGEKYKDYVRKYGLPYASKEINKSRIYYLKEHKNVKFSTLVGSIVNDFIGPAYGFESDVIWELLDDNNLKYSLEEE